MRVARPRAVFVRIADGSEGRTAAREGARPTPHPGPPPQGGREDDMFPPPLWGRVRVGGRSPAVCNPEENRSKDTRPRLLSPGRPGAWGPGRRVRPDRGRDAGPGAPEQGRAPAREPGH